MIAACHPAPPANSLFPVNGAFLSSNPDESVLFLTDLPDPCSWTKKPDQAPPYSSFVVLFRAPPGPREVPVLPAVEYIQARNQRHPGEYAGVLTHLAGARQNAPNSQGGTLHLASFEPGQGASGSYDLLLADGTRVRGDFTARWCEPVKPR